MKSSNITTPPSIGIANDTELDVDDVEDLGSTENKAREENMFKLDKIKIILKPLHFSLRCFGLAYDGAFQGLSSKFNSIEPENNTPTDSNDIEAGNEVDNRRQPMQSSKCNLGKCYCIAISVAMCYQVIVSFMNFFDAKNFLDIMQTSVPVAWMTLCASQQLVFFRASCTTIKKMSKFGKFLKELVSVKANDMSSTARQIKAIVLVAWLAYITNTFIVSFGLIFSADETTGRNEFREILVGKRYENFLIITYIYLSINLFLSGVWLFSTAAYVALCVLVAKRFDDVFKRTSAAISLKKSLNFAALRKEHVQLCHVVSALDDTLSPSCLVYYAIYIPITCVSLNVCIITFEESSTIKRVAFIFWIISNVIILFLVSVSGALVSHKTNSLSEVIYDINANDLDRESELEMMLLISNLNSNSTGLTVGGLTTIDKGMIITVFGTVVAYFTFLIQLK
ncbi:uncharacterized protein LOC116308271 [Actinia tenebrosa]|uniref:Uncharacterized protein LOC116308271 n=1 Tax=Actinia tenebrosa TaxID=6105 RepID=A0A6P8J4G1_ACTTE|nr:uncharacterized protein LOC116308271 [Actinia tenebrosa]